MASRLPLTSLLTRPISRPSSITRSAEQCVTKRPYSSDHARAVLQPFYQAVHPDYFEQYPQHKRINKESLRSLNSCLESGHLASQARCSAERDPVNLQFSVHPSVHAHLDGGDLKAALQSILSSVNWVLDSKAKAALAESLEDYSNTFHHGFMAVFDDERDRFFNRCDDSSPATPSFSAWLRTATREAAALRDSGRSTRQETDCLAERMAGEYGCKEVRISCQWSPRVALGVLKRLQLFLSNLDPSLQALLLRDTVVHLSSWNGISLQGDLHFDSNSLIAEWSQALPKLADDRLRWLKICDFEDLISKCLGNIKIERHPLYSLTSYSAALKDFHTSFSVQASPVFRPGSMDDHCLTIVPSSLSASLQRSSVFSIPCNMSQFEVARYLSSECGRAAKMRQIRQKSLAAIQALLEEVREQLKLTTLCISDTIDQNEALSFLTSVKALQTGRLWTDEISALDLDVMEGQHVVIDQARGVAPVGVIHIPWNLK